MNNMNESNTLFDNKLNKIEHYQRFPIMKPFVGKNYGHNESQKIMLIAESHYLPPQSTISQSPVTWYSSTEQNLNPEEKSLINTREIVSGDWELDEHMIYRELDEGLSEFMDISKFRAMTNVVFMHGFQRPSPKTFGYIKGFYKPIDYEIGAKTIENVINVLEPKTVIFVSLLSWEKLRSKIQKSKLRIDYDFVCYPEASGLYWHNKEYEYGLSKFKAILIKH